jgi:HEAT repeat protein
MRASRFITIVVLSLATTPLLARQAARPPLGDAEIDAIAEILMLEDVRRFDESAFRRLLASRHPEVRRRAVVALARIADSASRPLLIDTRTDADPHVVASTAFAAGQLKDADAVEWLAGRMAAADAPEVVAREAARSLGKMTATPAAREALATYLANAPNTPATSTVVGEALLSLGRFTIRGELSPILRWMTSRDVEVRWRAAWALFRPRDPAAVPYLLTLSRDRSPEVRFWAVRGLVPPTAPGRAGARSSIAAPPPRACATPCATEIAASAPKRCARWRCMTMTNHSRWCWRPSTTGIRGCPSLPRKP